MAAENSDSKTDAIVKLVIVFFICLLSFSIGTFVGKKFSDSQHKLAKYEPDAQDREIASVSPESGDVKPNEALSDSEVAKLAEEFVAEDKEPAAAPTHGEAHDEHVKSDKNVSPEHETPHAPASEHAAVTEHETPKRTTQSVETAAPEHAAPAAHAAPAKHASAPAVHVEKPMKAAEQVSHGEEPKAESAKPATVHERIPSALPKEVASSAIGKYTVQVAAYPDEAQAQKMSADLKAKGFSAFYVSATIKDKKANAEKTWYRVSVGLFTTVKEAETYKVDLLSRGKVGSAMIQKITE